MNAFGTRGLRRALGAAAVFLVALLVFLPARNYEFLRFDDMDYVLENPHLREGLTPRTVRWALTDVGYASNWHPLAWVSHAADLSAARALGLSCELRNKATKTSGRFDSGFAKLSHVHNIVLHAVNAALLFLLLAALSGRLASGVRGLLAAGFFALLWALHPLRTEVVCWVSERKELLCVFFMLLTMLAYVRSAVVVVERSCTKGVSNSIAQLPLFSTTSFCYILSLFTFALALLSKPVAVGLPAVLAAWELTNGAEGGRRRWRRALVRVLPFVLLAAGTCVLTMFAQVEARVSGQTIPPHLRVICALTAPAYYLQQTFWPFGLSIDYPVPTAADVGHLAVGLALLVGMAGAVVWWWARPNRWSGLGVLAVAWSYVGLVPMLGIVKVGVEPHSDRYTYWIGCGVAAVLALAAVRLRRTWRRCWRQVGYGCAGLLALLAVLSVCRASYWRNTQTLFADAVAKNASDDYALILALDISQKFDEPSFARAEGILRDVLSVNHSVAAEANLALLLSVKKVSGEASSRAAAEIEWLCSSALSVDPACATAWAALAFKDYRTGHCRRAVERMEKAFSLGYKPQIVEVDLEEWRERAAKEPEN